MEQLDSDRTRNLTHQVTHSIGLGILQGKYRRDQPFPSEAELSEHFNVSRSATREAVKMLTAKGLLSSRPRQGIRVMPEHEWNMFDTDVLNWILSSRPSIDLLREFVQMRIAIEPEAAALAAMEQDPKEIQLIASAVTRMREAEAGNDDPLESDIAFHSAILSASKNRFMAQMRPFCATALRVSIRHTNQIKGVRTADAAAHAKVYESIRKGDVNAARKNMKALLEEVVNLLNSKK